MLVVLSMQHSRNCCQGNTRLDLQGHEGICKLKQKEILFSKWSAQNVHEPSCEINWHCGIFKHGLMNCKHKATDRLRAPQTCPASFQLPKLRISHHEQRFAGSRAGLKNHNKHREALCEKTIASLIISVSETRGPIQHYHVCYADGQWKIKVSFLSAPDCRISGTRRVCP